MNATFDVTIKIDERNVSANFGIKEGAADLDVNLFGQILKVITDIEKKIKRQVDTFYSMTPENIPVDDQKEQQED